MTEREPDGELIGKINDYDTKFRLIEQRLENFSETINTELNSEDALWAAFRLGLAAGRQIEEGCWVLALNDADYLNQNDVLDLWQKRDTNADNTRQTARKIADEDSPNIT